MKPPESFGTPDHPFRIAIVGSGPSGFYAAMALLKENDLHLRVDIFDRLPTPFGLVRGGVAPDHQKIKSVAKIFEKTAGDSRLRFFGNVALGRDVQVADLESCYHQIIYAIGNESDRPLGIPGEHLEGCLPAGRFVGWYNAHPDFSDLEVDLGCDRAVVVGNGNVAVDVARILAKSADELRDSDIADYALDALAASKIREIVVLGRRGPVQAAFSPGEIRELLDLPGGRLTIAPEELALDPESLADLEKAPKKSSARSNFELLEIASKNTCSEDRRRILLRFLTSPVEVIGNAEGRMTAVRIEKNRLHRGEDGVLRPRGTGETEIIEAGLLLSSVGYRGTRTPGVPFDEKRGVIPNIDGRVVSEKDGTVLTGHYVVGWAMSGPRGLIGIHRGLSAGVVDLALEDLRAGRHCRPGLTACDISGLLEQRGVKVVSFEAWKKIDAAEIERGERRGAPRVKFSKIEDMLEVI